MLSHSRLPGAIIDHFQSITSEKGFKNVVRTPASQASWGYFVLNWDYLVF